MGFWNNIKEFGKKVLGGAVNVGRHLQTLRDKGLSVFNKIKDSLPGPLKNVIDTGLEFVMNSPVGRAIKGASGVLDTAVDAGHTALGHLKNHEASTGEPAATQLANIGQRVQAGDAQGAPDSSQQDGRLAALKQD